MITAAFLFFINTLSIDTNPFDSIMVDINKFESTYIPHIRDQISTGSLVLFTGAGFSLKAINVLNEELPSAKKLTELLWNVCFPDDIFEESTILQDIYEDALNKNNRVLTNLLLNNFSVNVDKCPDVYRQIFSYPWLRIYTLNIDNLAEKMVEIVQSTRKLNVISATNSRNSQLITDGIDVIHLNGSLDDVPDNITFSRSQYAERIGRDFYYNQLSADLLSRPVIFIGSSLEEDALWEHIISRGPKGSRGVSELRPRSYLVIPTLNKSRLSMLAKYNIVWIDMTLEQFYNQVLSKFDSVKAKGFQALMTRGLSSSEAIREIQLVSDISQVNIETEYLLGEEPTWSDFKNGKVADREIFYKTYEEVKNIRDDKDKNIILTITGTAGSGKSTVLYWIALKLLSEGLHIGWLDSSLKLSNKEFRESINKYDDLRILLINDADIYGNSLSSLIRYAVDRNPNLLVINEIRSTKVDRVIQPYELGDIINKEISVPNLTYDDIENLISVLDKENRLGQLKGMSHENQVMAFREKANSQLLVAMYEATSGKRFSDRASDELKELDTKEQLVYGLVACASCFRFYLTRDEIIIACGESSNDTLNCINNLVRRKVIIQHNSFNFELKARHRVIGQLIYEELVKCGHFERVLRGLILIGVSKANINSGVHSRPIRMLGCFINHQLLKKTIDEEVARNIYGQFEDALSWNSHYWLHRGALELDLGRVDTAENFLNQAMSISPSDLYIQTEWSYMLMKKALDNPLARNSQELIDEAINTLDSIILKKSSYSAYAYHIIGNEGLKWVENGLVDFVEKNKFLSFLEEKTQRAIKMFPDDSHIRALKNKIQEAILRLAV